MQANSYFFCNRDINVADRKIRVTFVRDSFNSVTFRIFDRNREASSYFEETHNKKNYLIFFINFNKK